MKYFYVTTVQQNSRFPCQWLKDKGIQVYTICQDILSNKNQNTQQERKSKKSSNNNKTPFEGSKQRKKVQRRRSSLFHKTSQKFPVSNQQMALKARTVPRHPAKGQHFPCTDAGSCRLDRMSPAAELLTKGNQCCVSVDGKQRWWRLVTLGGHLELPCCSPCLYVRQTQ